MHGFWTTLRAFFIFLAGTTSAAFSAPPASPLGVAMAANSADSITLTWYRPAANDLTDYVIYASEKADGPFVKVGAAKERTFTHEKLKPDTQMYYKVAATNADGESEPTKPVLGFTIKPAEPTPFPVKVAKNMCVSLGATILCDPPPVKGKLESLVDGLDATDCRLSDTCQIKIKLNAEPKIDDADYLMVHFRTGHGPYDFANDPFARTLKDYVITESLDSTDGKDGTWTEIAKGKNTYLDGVIVIPNHKPKWIGVRSLGKRELILCRLDIFRSAPAGFRNDYWIFTGDSLIVQDMPGGAIEGRTAWFSDLIHKAHPDRYPIVVHHARGGEMLKDTFPRMKEALPILSADNGTKTPTGTIVCWESGFNDVGVGGSLAMGPRIIKSLTDAQDLCKSHGLLMVPVRIEYATTYLDPQTLEPTKYNVFYNTLAVNLAGVDVFARANTPYAVDPETQLPFADYWSYVRANYKTLLGKDGVHHTRAGSDGINQLWAEVAAKMVYASGGQEKKKGP
jgi:hypothetical protein